MANCRASEGDSPSERDNLPFFPFTEHVNPYSIIISMSSILYYLVIGTGREAREHTAEMVDWKIGKLMDWKIGNVERLEIEKSGAILSGEIGAILVD